MDSKTPEVPSITEIEEQSEGSNVSMHKLAGILSI